MADDEYDSVEVELSDETIDTWIERLKELKDGKDHIHLEHVKGEIIAYSANR